GQVLSYEMTPDGRQIRFTIFVTAPYDRFVNEATRFWHASGLDFGIDAQGLHLQTQSVASLIAGGIAFGDLPDVDASKLAESPDHSLFYLYGERTQALQRPDSNGFDYRLLFASSVRGLAVGAEVDYRGLPIGEVTRIGVQGHAGPDNPEPLIAVDVRVYPRRLPSADKVLQDDTTQADQRRRIDPMVARGLRAQLRTGNLLTQQLYVALDYFPNTPKAAIDWHPAPPILPTVPGSFDSLQDSLTDLAAKLDRLPLETIAQDLHHTLTDVDTTLQHVDGLVQHLDASVAPEAQQTLAEARKALVDLQRTLDHVDQTVGPGAAETLQEVSRAAQSLKALADALNRHPESLIRGKPEDPK
ncbi:MAG TPA: MlaD family protein, partial [Burkholderiaceae bacterium]|nr:MlaD family protein [Burkholderiaceae bacterium]